jgi:hypothetical protein
MDSYDNEWQADKTVTDATILNVAMKRDNPALYDAAERKKMYGKMMVKSQGETFAAAIGGGNVDLFDSGWRAAGHSALHP